MAQQAPPRAVSQFPHPPTTYYNSFPPTPPPPPTTTYSMFGTTYTTDDTPPTLSSSGRKQLYDPSAPICSELLRLNKELLQHFRTLVTKLCSPLPPDADLNPYQEHIQNIEDTFVNMQYLINSLRPLQATWDLQTILHRQTHVRKEMTANLKQAIKKAWTVITEAGEKLAQPAVQVDLQKHATTQQIHDDTVEQQPMRDLLAEIQAVVQDPNL